MSERKNERKEQYKHARNAFEDLSVEDKAVFLVEAMASTLARGAEAFGRALADVMEDAMHGYAEEEAAPPEDTEDEGEKEAPADTSGEEASEDEEKSDDAS